MKRAPRRARPRAGKSRSPQDGGAEVRAPEPGCVFQFLAQDFAQGADGHRRAALSERCAQCFVDQCLITLAFLFRTPAECLQNRIVQINRDARLAGRREHRAAQRLTATQDRDTLVTNAKTDFGHFLAVKYLLPVAIEGSSAVLSTIHTDLYAQWESDKTARAAGGIDLNFTDAYLADRSAFLTWKNHLALRDRSAAAAPYTDAPDAWFRDYATSLTIHLGATLTDSTAKPRYLFGADQASGTEMLEGGTNADRIYGGGGADHLYGHGGRDHLEGGAGDDRLYGGDQDDTLIGGEGSDRLEGGKGFDTYIVGQGTDTIVDEDGLGVVKDGQGRILAGAFIQGADGRYSWAGNPAVTATHNSPLTITLENGAQVVIDNYDAFAEGELGIELIAAPTPLTPGRTILGDLEPIDTDPTEPGVQTASDELGNLLVSGEAPGRADHLYDSAGADLIQSGGGNDTVHASRGGADRIEAGAGRDSVAAGAGDDLVLGGTEADILEGQAGADRLYADAETSTAEALTLGLSQTASGRQGDWINGGAGDDLLVAGLDNDALFGGAGADRQVGGASIGVMFEGSKIRNRRFGKSQSPQHGDKSRTAWDGEQTAANDIERRIAA